MSNGVEQLSKKGAVLASLDRSGVETCAARRSVSLAATGATGSYPARLWRQCVMAAALSFASDALAQSATAVRHLASPALAVKAGRQRGPSVLDKRRQEQQQEMAAAEAAAAKRKKIFRPTASVLSK